MYPLKFKPFLKTVLWGGERISAYKGIHPVQKDIGESWEISTVPQSVSEILNGEWKGRLLTDLIKEQKGKLIGKRVYEKYKDNFPLLFKFIDTKDHCSIQVHPDDEIARRKHNSNGKTEMWYVIDANPDAALISGFAEKITPEEYRKRIKDKTIEKVLAYHSVKPGDVFFIPAGRIHAIGRGLLVAEIQQNSDITYRAYDYGRTNENGNERELHIEESVEALDFSVIPENELKLETQNRSDSSIELVSCPYFNVNLLNVSKTTVKDYASLDSFVVYMCTNGEGTLSVSGQDEVSFKQGESILIPAAVQSVRLKPNGLSSLKILECFL